MPIIIELQQAEESVQDKLDTCRKQLWQLDREISEKKQEITSLKDKSTEGSDLMMPKQRENLHHHLERVQSQMIESQQELKTLQDSHQSIEQEHEQAIRNLISEH